MLSDNGSLSNRIVAELFLRKFHQSIKSPGKLGLGKTGEI